MWSFLLVQIKVWGSLAWWNQDHKMLCVSRYFERASGPSVFVLSNCYVGQTPPLGQSDKCRDRLASPSLSNLFTYNPHCLPTSHLPPFSHLPHRVSFYLKLTFRQRCSGFFKVAGVSNYWYSPKLWISILKLQAKSFSWQALSRHF